MLQPQYEEYLMKNRIFHAIPVPLEANHPKLGMEANHLKLGMKEVMELVGMKS